MFETKINKNINTNITYPSSCLMLLCQTAVKHESISSPLFCGSHFSAENKGDMFNFQVAIINIYFIQNTHKIKHGYNTTLQEHKSLHAQTQL